MRIPARFTQGDSISWTDIKTKNNLGEEISSDNGWEVSYAIRGSSNPLDLDGVPNAEGGWSFSITSEQSAALKDGLQFWQASAEKNGVRHTLGNGRIEVEKNLSLVTGAYDGRSQAQKDLDQVQKAIRALVSGGAIQQYSIGGRSFTKMTLSELQNLETRLKHEVAKEKASNGGPNPFKVLVRFS